MSTVYSEHTYRQSTVRPETTATDIDTKGRSFAIALPIVMLVLLFLVPIFHRATSLLFVGVLVPLAIYFAFNDPERAFYVYVAWCWMDGTIRGVLGGGVVVALSRDLLLALMIGGWALSRLQTRYQDPVRTPPATLLLGLFAVLCVIQFANPHAISVMNSLGALKTHLSAIPLYFFAFDVFRRSGQVRNLFIFLTLATAVIGSVSVLQYLMGKDWTFAHYPGTEQIMDTSYNFVSGKAAENLNLFKPPGTTDYGGATGVFLSVVSPLLFSLLLMPRRPGQQPAVKLVYASLLLGFIVAIFINGLRIALVQAVIGLVACAFVCGGRLRTRAIGAILACLAVSMMAFVFSAGLSGGVTSTRFSSLLSDPVQALHDDRSTFFEQVVDLSLNSPLGVGLGRNGAAAQFTDPKDKEDLGFGAYSESYLGFMILETGIPGALLIALVAGVFLREGYRALTSTRTFNDRLMASGLLAVLITIVFNFFFGPILVQPPGSVLYWTFAAVLIRVYGQGVARPADLKAWS